MSIGEEIRSLNRAQPFKAFTIHTNDGKALPVRHPDYCFIDPKNVLVYVYSNRDTRDIVPARSISRVEHETQETADSAD